MARAAREKFPLSIECKNVEKLNVWEAYEQASENCGDYEPIVVMKKNRKKPLPETANRKTVLVHNMFFADSHVSWITPPPITYSKGRIKFF